MPIPIALLPSPRLPRKPRTPPPPRRVQAPQTRRDERPKRGLVLVVAAAAALALVGAAAGAYFLLRDDTSKTESVAQTMRAAGCTFRTFPARAAGVHIGDPDAKPKEWNSFPPTSGPHHGQWVIWGQYDEPVPLASAVHNLEHGGVVVYYGRGVGDEQVSELVSFYRDDPTAMLLAPLPELGNKIALTAWYTPDPNETGQGILGECTRFDENAFEAFRDAYRFHGPESPVIPRGNLEPGT
jgi:hypothetical protein